MDCVICYNEITKSTGKIELSCSHNFHINCLTNWFKTQSEGHIEQTCPCCRHETNEDEQMPMVEKAEQARFQDMLTVYEEQVTRWYISANDTVTSYRRTIDILEENLVTSKAVIDSYQKQADKYRLLVESARQAEIKNAKKMSVDKWAQWSESRREKGAM